MFINSVTIQQTSDVSIFSSFDQVSYFLNVSTAFSFADLVGGNIFNKMLKHSFYALNEFQTKLILKAHENLSLQL